MVRRAVVVVVCSLAVLACTTEVEEEEVGSSEEAVSGMWCPAETPGRNRQYATLVSQAKMNACESANGANRCRDEACQMAGGFTPDVRYALCCALGTQTFDKCLQTQDQVACSRVLSGAAAKEFWSAGGPSPMQGVLDKLTAPTKPVPSTCNAKGGICNMTSTKPLRCSSNPRCTIFHVESTVCAQVTVDPLVGATTTHHACIDKTTPTRKQSGPFGSTTETTDKGNGRFFHYVVSDVDYGSGYVEAGVYKRMNGWWPQDAVPDESLCDRCYRGRYGTRPDQVGPPPPPPPPPPAHVCVQGGGKWCSESTGNVPSGYGSAAVGTKVSYYLTSCPSKAVTTCTAGCVKQAAGQPDRCL